MLTGPYLIQSYVYEYIYLGYNLIFIVRRIGKTSGFMQPKGTIHGYQKNSCVEDVDVHF